MGAAASALPGLWGQRCPALPALGQLRMVPCLHQSCQPESALPSLTLFLLLLRSLMLNFAASP